MLSEKSLWFRSFHQQGIISLFMQKNNIIERIKTKNNKLSYDLCHIVLCCKIRNTWPGRFPTGYTALDRRQKSSLPNDKRLWLCENDIVLKKQLSRFTPDSHSQNISSVSSHRRGAFPSWLSREAYFTSSISTSLTSTTSPAS